VVNDTFTTHLSVAEAPDNPAYWAMSWSRINQSKAFQFASGIATSLIGCGVVYMVCDGLSECVTLRTCQRLVLPLAASDEQLTGELGAPIFAGPMYSSSIRTSPSGRLAQCHFRIDGRHRSSDVTATVRRLPYSCTFLYNLVGPGTWELIHCHVLVGATPWHML
jgi:hypothetical protein